MSGAINMFIAMQGFEHSQLEYGMQVLHPNHGA